MNPISEVNNNKIDQIKAFDLKSANREIQPINVVNISELKIDITGSTGTLINEIIESFDADPVSKDTDFDLKEIKKAINKYLRDTETDLEIEIDNETNQPIFKIIKTDDKEVIKEIPPKEVLDLLKRIRSMVGSLCDCAV